MELHQLSYFCAIARSGSFTRAAEEERIAQPSLSQQIQKLEIEVGAPLLLRLGRSVQLTEFGEAFLPKAKTVLRELEEARRAIDNLQDDVRGKLIVGAIPTVMPYFLASRVVGFATQFPNVELLLKEDITPRLIERLQAGELDVVVASLSIYNPRPALERAVPRPDVPGGCADASPGLGDRGRMAGLANRKAADLERRPLLP
jgi:LysR family transcriptional regulator, hydrogen peroxide-inducible genes activator